MCDSCNSKDGPLARRISEYHEILRELALEIIQHALDCDNDECEYGRMVTRHLGEMMAEEMSRQMELLSKIVQKANDSINHQIRLEQRNGRFTPERLLDLARSAEGAIQAEFNLMNQPRQEGDPGH